MIRILIALIAPLALGGCFSYSYDTSTAAHDGCRAAGLGGDLPERGGASLLIVAAACWRAGRRIATT